MSSRAVSASHRSSPLRDVEVLEVEVVVAAASCGIEVSTCSIAFCTRALELVVLDHDRLDREAGLELDLVDGVQVGRVGDADVQALAALDERQDAVLREQLVADEPDRVEVDRDRVEVEQRHAEFLGGGDRDVAGGGHVVRHEPADEVGLALAGARDRVEHGGFVDQAVEHEPLRQAGQHRPRPNPAAAALSFNYPLHARLTLPRGSPETGIL